jgi:hypothetical protein
MAEVPNPAAATNATGGGAAAKEAGAASDDDGDGTAQQMLEFPAMLRVARAVNPNRVSAVAWMVVLLWFGFTYPLSRLLGAHAEEDNTALAWVYDLCMLACMGMFATTSFGLQRAVAEEGGGLEALGMGGGVGGKAGAAVTLSQARNAVLFRWRVALGVLSFLWIGVRAAPPPLLRPSHPTNVRGAAPILMAMRRRRDRSGGAPDPLQRAVQGGPAVQGHRPRDHAAVCLHQHGSCRPRLRTLRAAHPGQLDLRAAVWWRTGCRGPGTDSSGATHALPR